VFLETLKILCMCIRFRTSTQEVRRGAAWLDAPTHFPHLTRLRAVTVAAEYDASYPSAPSVNSLAVALVSFFALLSAGLLLFALATPEMHCLELQRRCEAALGLPYSSSSSSGDEMGEAATANPMASTDAPRRGFGRIVARTPTGFGADSQLEEAASPPGERGAFEYEMTSPGGGLLII
jgi:hypothetical protein